MLEYIPDLSWQAWTAIGVGAFVVAPRVVDGLITTAVLTTLAGTAAVCLYIAGSTAIPMVVGSWQAHQANIASVHGYDKAEVRSRLAPTVCPGYFDASWLEQTVRAETRKLSWCEAYEGRL